MSDHVKGHEDDSDKRLQELATAGQERSSGETTLAPDAVGPWSEVAPPTLDVDARPIRERRPAIAGRGQALSDIIDSQPEDDWEPS